MSRYRNGITLLVCVLSTQCLTGISARCPFAGQAATMPMGHGSLLDIETFTQRSLLQAFDANKVASLDIRAVKADLTKLMTDSQPFWPADFGHYGGLMIRLAWHCNGSYRQWDGRGGCNGARIRFNPEHSWPDNTNLDKALKLLEPIKAKYGDALSWGDLIVLAGDTAIESMGGPVLGFCAGRIDDVNGSASLPLGPTPEQQLIAPCTTGDGMCEQPLGQTTMGLIYVNPEGVMGNPVPNNSVAHIRGTFKNMAMNDSETVALIGGGHAFGKTHGACLTGAGPDPTQSPANPWPGTCGNGSTMGKGNNTFTSGFEGAWTTQPTQWSNEYFRSLLEYDYEKHKGPGGHWQWRPVTRKNATGPEATANLPDIMMLTADMALLEDPEYLRLVKLYAANQTELDKAFSNAWYKLMTRDMGPHARCIGPQTPPPQDFQMPLPSPAANQPDFNAVKTDIVQAMTTPNVAMEGDTVNGTSYYGALFAYLAYQCANTYRATDYTGGCNGAKIRFSPQKDWPTNAGLDKVLEVLAPVKAKYPTLSWADLIVLAGTISLDKAAADAGSPGVTFKFCYGRSDAVDGNGTDVLAPRQYINESVALADNALVAGLSPREVVALAGMPRSPTQQQRLNYSGSWTTSDVSTLDNSYYKVLLGEMWEPVNSTAGAAEFKAVGKEEIYMMPSDIAITQDPAFAVYATEFAADNAAFLQALADAWWKLMNADRFDGPAGNVCSRAQLRR